MNLDGLKAPYQESDYPSIHLGGILVNAQLLSEAPVHLVLKSFNRHGLIAGATGSGKTKTIQVLCEQLSLSGIPSLVMDIKGDISGLAVKGEVNETLTVRNQSMQLDYIPRVFHCELMTLDDQDLGIPMRATVESMGPILFSRMLQLNETQTGVTTVLFEYAKSKKMAIIELADFKALLQFAQSEQGQLLIQKDFGALSRSSLSALMRKIIGLESQRAVSFFGEPAFQVEDLLRVDSNGEGIISLLRLMDMQDKPKLFSTFMLNLLSRVYRTLPEEGDPQKPKLVLFIDEAHLIFKEASPALLSLLETMVKLIRSKGVSLMFCTQTANDIPEAVLGQLGLKIQHALRAFTAKDRKAMRLVAQNFPTTEIYNTEELLTSLGIGEALVSALDAKGIPTPLIHCRIRAPLSRMGVLTPVETEQIISQSILSSKYMQRIDRLSAKEQLIQQQETLNQDQPVIAPVKNPANPSSSTIEVLSKNTLFRQVVRQLFRDLTKIILKALGIKK